jgi:predicted DNA-binding protein with PD1-like motif
MHSVRPDVPRYLAVRLDPGEDVLDALESAVRQHGIRNAAILSGVGSLKRYRVHVVETTNMPPGNVFFGGDGPYDILAVTGLVVNGSVHAHISFSDTRHAMGGHLETGCTVLTFAVVIMAEMTGADLTGWDQRGPLQVGAPDMSAG